MFWLIWPEAVVLRGSKYEARKNDSVPIVSGRVIDSRQFSGPGAVFGLVLAHVRSDYWWAPRDSEAYRTAEMFIEGGTCEHDGVIYDWKEHRDMIIGSLGMDVAGFVAAVKGGPRE